MAHLLNYRYEIFPTTPQRQKLNKILREAKIQWNKAVTIRRKLKTALNKGQFFYIINTCLKAGEDKSDKNANRKKAILKLQGSFRGIDFNTASRLYDIKNLVGRVIEIDLRHLNIEILASELKEKHRKELAERTKKKTEGLDYLKLPKLTVYWQLMRAISQYGGYAAKDFMDNSFEAPKSMALSTVRFNISGSKNALRWNTAVTPSKQQRKYGATGDPKYKKRGESFAYQIQNAGIEDIILNKKNGNGYNIHIKALPKGMDYVDMAYHREISMGSNIKLLTLSSKARRYFVALSAEVPESAWAIIPSQEGWMAGIDPGASTALTIGLINKKTGELRHLAIHYEFLEKSLVKLEKMQQALALKRGPRRKRIGQEIDEALTAFTTKRSIQRLLEPERGKAIAKERVKLETRMIKQEPSKRWLRWSKRRSELQFKIANQRNDVLHKISRALVEGCDAIGFGHWEPEREVSYRKKLRALKKKVKMGITGAEQELNALIEDKSKQGRKGVKKIRRGGRDRSIATLRSRIEEKAKRANTIALVDINEAGSTIKCCCCGEQTGPRGDLSVRAWKCSKCNAVHHRDLNGSYNILKGTLENAAAQAAAPETGSTVARTITQGVLTTLVSALGNRLRTTGLSGRGDINIQEQALTGVPILLEGEMIGSLKSLLQMGIAGPIRLQTGEGTGSKSPPA